MRPDQSQAPPFHFVRLIFNPRGYNRKALTVLVIIAVNVNTAYAIVNEAKNNNVKVIAYDRLIKNCNLDYFIGSDGMQIGQLQAEYAINKKPKGNYILLEGDKVDVNAGIFEMGQQSKLSEKIKNGDINILYRVFISEWSPIEAQHEIEKVITPTDKKIDAIIAANYGTASGAIKALQKYGLNDNTIITGLDAELAACQRIVKGEQSMTRLLKN